VKWVLLVWLGLLCAFVPFWSRFNRVMKRKEENLWKEHP
jgi:hypothetical protein